MGTRSLPGVRSGRGVTLSPLPPSSAVVKERVELYLYFPYGPYGLYRASVPVQGCTLPLLRSRRLVLCRSSSWHAFITWTGIGYKIFRDKIFSECHSWHHSRKVAGSIPDGVIGLFHWNNISGRTMVLGSTQPLTEMSTRDVSWG